MKMMVWITALCLLLSGCSAATLETLGDVAHVAGTQAPMLQISLDFPQDSAVLTASGTDSIYTCDKYTMWMQVLPAGDTRATFRQVCGYEPGQLTIMESTNGPFSRYDWVWTAAGENADVICRGAILDDGNYHYCLCVSADAAVAGELTDTWNELFSSFCLEQSQT